MCVKFLSITGCIKQEEGDEGAVDLNAYGWSEKERRAFVGLAEEVVESSPLST